MNFTIKSKRRSIAGVGALTLAALVAAGPTLTSAQSSQPWSTFHGSGTRSGVSPVSGPTTRFVSAKWFLPKAIESSAVVDAGGVAYVGDDDGSVYALDPAKPGVVKWSFATHADAVLASPTLSQDGKRLYVASDNGAVYALNSADGTQIWVRDLGGFLQASPLLSTDGSLLYEPTVGGGIKAINTSDGTIAKSVPISGNIAGSLAISPDGTTLYAATANILYGVTAPTASSGGQLSPFYTDRGSVSSPSVDTSGNIYVTTSQGSLMSFTPSQGQARWTFTVPNFAASISTAAVTQSLTYFGSSNGNLYAVNTSNGQQQWSAHTGGSIKSSPAVATGNNIVYVGSDDGNVYAFDAATGAVRWNYSAGAAVSASPALAGDGSLWVGSQSGTMYRFFPASLPGGPSGTPTRATSTPGPTSTPAPTSTTVPQATVVPVPTPTIALKLRVKDGQKQIVTITTQPNAVVRIRVQYPNGDHQSGHATANAAGKAVYKYKQGASKVLHNRFYATVTAQVGTGTGTAQYKILFGKIDASAEPRTVKAGSRVNLWVHTKAHVNVKITLTFPNHRTATVNGHTGPKGFTHPSYKVPRGTIRGSNHKVVVVARLAKQSNVNTKTTFTIK